MLLFLGDSKVDPSVKKFIAMILFINCGTLLVLVVSSDEVRGLSVGNVEP